MFSKLFPRNKIQPDQAGFIRRGLAFAVDAAIITVLSLLVYSGYAELKARLRHETSPAGQVAKTLSKGGNITISTETGISVEQEKKMALLDLLKGRIPYEQYQKATAMTDEEIASKYPKELAAASIEKAKEALTTSQRERDNAYNIIKEYIITLLYFVLFFRYGGRTPGKRLFGLKVVDLEGNQRLGWYQCFERAHGYVCSGLFASLGFWQVLWDRQGLSMHDRIATTTVIRLPEKPKEKKSKMKKSVKKEPKEKVDREVEKVVKEERKSQAENTKETDS
ncbi:MAG: RDD family protein [Acidobacteriota bacterium]|nr:RDD family protein [Acidobacteriota bacterium]